MKALRRLAPSLQPTANNTNVNFGHPLSVGLVGAWPTGGGSKLVDAVAGRDLTLGFSDINGGVYFQQSELGRVPRFFGGNGGVNAKYLNSSDTKLNLGGANKLSLSVWLRPTTTNPGDTGIIGAWNTNGYMIYSSGSELRLYINGSWIGTSGAGVTGFPDVNRLHHVAATWDGVTQVGKIYLNGKLVVSGSLPQSSIVSSAPSIPFQLCGYNDNNGVLYGQVAIPAIWNRVLTDNEISDLYLTPFILFSPPALLSKGTKGCIKLTTGRQRILQPFVSTPAPGTVYVTQPALDNGNGRAYSANMQRLLTNRGAGASFRPSGWLALSRGIPNKRVTIVAYLDMYSPPSNDWGYIIGTNYDGSNEALTLRIFSDVGSNILQLNRYSGGTGDTASFNINSVAEGTPLLIYAKIAESTSNDNWEVGAYTRDGKLVGSATSSFFATAREDIQTYIGSGANQLVPWRQYGKPIYYVAFLEGFTSEAKLCEIAKNPWQVFEDEKRFSIVSEPTETGTSTVTAAYPTALESSSATWTTTGAATPEAAINELLSSNSEYITSPGTTSGDQFIIFTLSNSLPIGTWYINYTANASGSGSVKYELLDSSNTVVGTSSKVYPNSSFNSNELAITTTGIATKIKIIAGV